MEISYKSDVNICDQSFLVSHNLKKLKQQIQSINNIYLKKYLVKSYFEIINIKQQI